MRGRARGPTVAADALIEIRDVTKTYGAGETAVHALRGVSLRVDAGEYVAVMGSSGSGKSTLMNILGCLDVPSRGEYWLDGTDVARLTEEQHARPPCRRTPSDRRAPPRVRPFPERYQA